MKRRSKSVQPYSDFARTYDIRDFPSVKVHWKFDETSGTLAKDEVNGNHIHWLDSATMDYSIPHAIGANPNGTNTPPGETPVQYPTLAADKFIMVLSVFRAIDDGVNYPGQGAGSCSLGLSGNVPVIAGAITGAMHFFVHDDALLSASVSDGPTYDPGDYILTTIIRPSIGSECGVYLYNLDGTDATPQTGSDPLGHGNKLTVTNPGWGAITPTHYTHLYPPGNIMNRYQEIVYQFDAEPADLTTGIKWHGAAAPNGIKSPYPPWRGKT